MSATIPAKFVLAPINSVGEIDEAPGTPLCPGFLYASGLLVALRNGQAPALTLQLDARQKQLCEEIHSSVPLPQDLHQKLIAVVTGLEWLNANTPLLMFSLPQLMARAA